MIIIVLNMVQAGAGAAQKCTGSVTLGSRTRRGLIIIGKIPPHGEDSKIYFLNQNCLF
jgi:hypothetical protein